MSPNETDEDKDSLARAENEGMVRRQALEEAATLVQNWMEWDGENSVFMLGDIAAAIRALAKDEAESE